MRASLLFVLASICLVGCAPAASTATLGGSPSQASAGPKHLTAAILGDLKTLGTDAGQFARPVRGLLQAGLANLDEKGQLRPQLAQAIPTVENGLWKVLPDGRMETTWKIRSGAQWHDGTAFTSDDALFTAQVAQDRELPAFRDPAYQSVQLVEAPDPQTVVVTWKELFIGADQLFPNPLPKHLLETTAREDKANLGQLSYWAQDFIGTGQFKVKEWVSGSHVLLAANDAYVLGRPKIDEIDVKLITNSSTFVTNLLAGSVELSLGLTLSFDQALEVRDSWQLGHVEIVPRPGWIVMFPQFAHTNPSVVGDVRFRRAMLQAINRQELVDQLVAGLSTVADSILPVGQPNFAEVRARAPRYPYDPRLASQMIEDLGYVRGDDGAYRDSVGQRLGIEVRSATEEKALFSIADYWQRIGVPTEPTFISAQAGDREYLATFPAFRVDRHTADETWLVNFTSATSPTRENNWTGNNYGGYRNAEYDALYDRYTKTIPMKERIELIGELAYRIADQAVAMGLYYDSLVAFIGNRVTDLVVSQYYGTQFTWSSYLWDVRG